MSRDTELIAFPLGWLITGMICKEKQMGKKTFQTQYQKVSFSWKSACQI